MSRRGSAQLLLLSFQSRRARAWMLGMVAGAVASVALVQITRDFVLEGGLVQAIRQSAWQHALAGRPEPAPLPWEEGAPQPAPSVPRLGLSAALVKAAGQDVQDVSAAPAQDPHLPKTKLGDVKVGDQITVTRADGSSRIYRVTGRKVPDPHLADSESENADRSQTSEACLPLESALAGSIELVIQVTKSEPPAPAEPGPEL